MYTKIVYLINSFIWFLQDFINLFKRNKIFICGFFKRERNCFISNNWGDDINISFIEYITDFHVLVINNSHLYRFCTPQNYSCIGSVIGYFTNSKTIIWGSGLISEDMEIPEKPAKVFSVRGPLTRNVLLKHGIDCPPVYGDPALLISRFYKPKVEKKYKLGIIPHVVDANNKFIQEFSKINSDVIVISMSKYADWHEIPDKICSCEKVLSSSLHGLIISDSYGIPNLWVQFSENIVGGLFKYLDYFKSVNRNDTKPLMINSLMQLEELYENNQYQLAKNIDYLSILTSCPFKDHIKNLNYYAENINNSTSI